MKIILDDLITPNNIALLSACITLLIFFIGRIIETRYKKLEEKKVHYLKLIKLMEKSLTESFRKNENGEIVVSDDYKEMFFDVGSSLLLYGSKNIYRKYLFFREFSNNPLIKQCKYYREDIIIYLIADILKAMRKEVGLSFFNSISRNEALGFFINDISNNPIAKEKEMNMFFNINMIKFELFMIDRIHFIFIKKVFVAFIKPLLAGLGIVIKYVFVIPIGRVIVSLFPRYSDSTKDVLDKK